MTWPVCMCAHLELSDSAPVPTTTVNFSLMLDLEQMLNLSSQLSRHPPPRASWPAYNSTKSPKCSSPPIYMPHVLPNTCIDSQTAIISRRASILHTVQHPKAQKRRHSRPNPSGESHPSVINLSVRFNHPRTDQTQPAPPSHCRSRHS